MFLEDRRKSTVGLRRKPPDPNVGSHLPPPPARQPLPQTSSHTDAVVASHEPSPSPPRPADAAVAFTPRPPTLVRASWPPEPQLQPLQSGTAALVYVQPIPIERIFHYNMTDHNRHYLPGVPQRSPRGYDWERPPPPAYEAWMARVPFDGARHRYAFS